MGYSSLISYIQSRVYENDSQAISGTGLQEALLQMVASLGDGYQFKGVATPTTNPGTPDQNVFYIASEVGTYSNFGLSVGENEVAVFLWNGTWSKQSTGAASAEAVNQLGQKINKGVTGNGELDSFIKELYISPGFDITTVASVEVNSIGIINLLNSGNTTILNITKQSNGLWWTNPNDIGFGGAFAYALIAEEFKPGTYPVSLGENVQKLNTSPGILAYLISKNGQDDVLQITKNIGSYVNVSGQVVSNANYFKTTPIPVKRGDVLCVYATGNSSTAIISYCDEAGTTFTPAVIYSGTDNDYYPFVVSFDGYICVSGHKSFFCYVERVYSEIYRQILSGASIGTPTASVDGNTGTPEVSVEKTIQNGQVVFNFIFKNLKGSNGQDGAVGPQGPQGNSGYSGAAGELEVVNNTTDGGATAALSAEQGKILANFTDYNNIPTTRQVKNPNPITSLAPLASAWTSDADGSVGGDVDIYDEVFQKVRKATQLNSTASGRFYRPFGVSVDFSTNVLRCSFCLQKDYDVTMLGSFLVELYSGGVIDSAHRATFIEQYGEANASYNQQYVRGGWFHFNVNPASLIASGDKGVSFDMTQVTHIGIHVYHDNSSPLTIFAGDISVVRAMLKPGIVNIVDNFDVSVPNMADYAASKGVKLNLSIVPGWIGTAQSASLEEINRCKRLGHFIFNHTWNHVTDSFGLTERQIVEEITKSNDWMVHNGFARGAKCISNPSAMFPFSKYKAYMESPAEMIFHHWTKMGNLTQGSILLYYPYEPMQRLLSISALDNNSTTHAQAQDTLVRMKAAIDAAETYGGIAVIGSHGTFWSADQGETWEQLIDYIASKTGLHNYGIDEIIEGNFV